MNSTGIPLVFANSLVLSLFSFCDLAHAYSCTVRGLVVFPGGTVVFLAEPFLFAFGTDFCLAIAI